VLHPVHLSIYASNFLEIVQESLANTKVSTRQQCTYDGS